MCLFLGVCVWGGVVHASAGALRGQKRMLVPLELGLQGFVSPTAVALRTKLESSAKATSSVNR